LVAMQTTTQHWRLCTVNYTKISCPVCFRVERSRNVCKCFDSVLGTSLILRNADNAVYSCNGKCFDVDDCSDRRQDNSVIGTNCIVVLLYCLVVAPSYGSSAGQLGSWNDECVVTAVLTSERRSWYVLNLSHPSITVTNFPQYQVLRLPL